MRGLLLVADAVLSFRVHMWALRPVEFARGLLRVYAASPFEGRCSVSGRGRGRRSVRVCLPSICPGGARRCILPGSDVIELHEIHLARLSSLQVPVGHIAVPGDIKLCSPGTFGVANYLIINNGSYQVNFTKPNSATIRYTNSQLLREDATGASLGRVPVPKCR